MKITLNKHNDLIQKSISEIEKEKIIERIWQKDFTVWSNDPTEISNRLGWLDCADLTPKSFDEINAFVQQIRKDGFTHALLLGMGGSSHPPRYFI